MFFSRTSRSIALLVGGMLLPLSSSGADTSYSHVVGFVSDVIRGDGSLTFSGVPLERAPEYEGVVAQAASGAGGASGSGGSLLFSGVNFSSVLESDRSYYAELVNSASGVAHNSPVVDWDGGSLNLADDLSDVIVAGQSVVRIIPLYTIGELFGTDGDVVQGGTVATADMIMVPRVEDGQLVSVYYSRGGFTGEGWRQIGVTGNQSSRPIYFTDGFYIQKNSVGAGRFTTCGKVRESALSVVIPTGFTVLSSPYPQVKLSDFPVAGSSGSSGLRAGTVATADFVMLDNDGDGAVESYYYSSGGFNGAGWRRVGLGGDRSSVSVGSGFGIHNNGSAFVMKFEAVP